MRPTLPDVLVRLARSFDAQFVPSDDERGVWITSYALNSSVAAVFAARLVYLGFEACSVPDRERHGAEVVLDMRGPDED